MIELIRLIISRLRHGYKIAENCYLVSGTRDEWVVACGDRKVKFYMERLRGKPDRIIYKGSDKKWLPSHERESISEEQYQFILNALVNHFEKLGEVVKCQ